MVFILCAKIYYFGKNIKMYIRKMIMISKFRSVLGGLQSSLRIRPAIAGEKRKLKIKATYTFKSSGCTLNMPD